MKTLGNTNLVTLKPIKIEKGSLPVDVRRSKRHRIKSLIPSHSEDLSSHFIGFHDNLPFRSFIYLAAHQKVKRLSTFICPAVNAFGSKSLLLVIQGLFSAPLEFSKMAFIDKKLKAKLQ